MRRRLPALVAVLTLGCGGGSNTPTAPQGPPSANLTLRGTLNFTSCVIGQCSFEGEGVNNGPGCATNVRGITRLMNTSNTEIARAAWNLASNRRVRPNEAFLYDGCCFTTTAANTPGSYVTEFTWDSIAC